MRKFIQHLTLERFITFVLFSTLLIAAAHADVLSTLNYVRQHDCGSAVSLPKLQLQSALGRAAKQTVSGIKPHDAVQAAGYAAVQLASIHLQGFTDERALQKMFAQKYCQLLSDPNIRDVGITQRDSELWILLGAARGDPGNATAADARVLSLVNLARSQSRHCGKQIFAATSPLKLNALLTQAAQAHANEMARYRFMEHIGRDGSTPATRIALTGYKWTLVGENVAAGAGTGDQVVADWLGSPGHCANIMNPSFSDMGVAFAINNADDYGVYWAQEFAAPKIKK